MSGKIRATMGLIPYKKEVCLACEFLLPNALEHQSVVLWLITLQPVHVASRSPNVWRNQEHIVKQDKQCYSSAFNSQVIAGTRNKTSKTTTMQAHGVPTSTINPQRLHSLHWDTQREHHLNMFGVMPQSYQAVCWIHPSLTTAVHD